MQKDNSDYSQYKKKNFNYGEKVTVQRTNSELDGMFFTVVGIAFKEIINHYILEAAPGTFIPGHSEWKCFQITEACIERVW